MFSLKTFIRKKILQPDQLFSIRTTNKFPDKADFFLKNLIKIISVRNRLKENSRFYNLGDLFSYPHPIATFAWKRLIKYSPNNLGNWSIKQTKPDFDTAKIEKEFIYKMVDLYRASSQKLEGYVTSGGTEANIFSSWMGRNYLRNKVGMNKKICMLITSLTHYSIKKSANLIDIPYHLVPINKTNWGMSANYFLKTVEDLIKKGNRGFLLPLTLGYTLTGTSDPYKKLIVAIRQLKKRHKNIHFYIWIDAALNGLIKPFEEKDFKPFQYPEIQTLLTDFHKFGFSPLPAGLILYRRELRKFVEKPIDYLSQNDNTLLGSRPGLAPFACWCLIQKLGKKEFRKIIGKNRGIMNSFIKKCKNNYGSKLIIVNAKDSLSCGLIARDNLKNFKFLEKKYGLKFKKVKILFEEKTESIKMAKAFFIRYNLKKFNEKYLSETRGRS